MQLKRQQNKTTAVDEAEPTLLKSATEPCLRRHRFAQSVFLAYLELADTMRCYLVRNSMSCGVFSTRNVKLAYSRRK